jgi:hypothetical protein
LSKGSSKEPLEYSNKSDEDVVEVDENSVPVPIVKEGVRWNFGRTLGIFLIFSISLVRFHSLVQGILWKLGTGCQHYAIIFTILALDNFENHCWKNKLLWGSR